MYKATLICKPILDKIINCLGIGDNLREVADRMQTVMNDNEDKERLI